MKRGLFGLLLAVAMMCSASLLLLQVFAQELSATPIKCNIVSAHWSKDAAEKLSEKNAIPFPEDQLLPDQAIKKYEFALMLHKALDIQINYLVAPNIKDYYDDIKQNAPYASAVIDLTTAHIFEGNGSFHPEEGLTKEEMVHYIMQAYQYSMAEDYPMIKIGPSTFKDADKISAKYSGDVAMAQHYGLIIGNGNNMFQPQNAATRAEAIVVISRLVDLLDQQNQQVSVEPKAIMNADSIEMKIIIHNNSKHDRTITQSSGQQFDFELLDANKKVLYKWSDGKFFTLALIETTIEAGKTLEFSDTFSGDAYKAIKDKIVYMKAYVNGEAEFIDAAGYEIKIK